MLLPERLVHHSRSILPALYEPISLRRSAGRQNGRSTLSFAKQIAAHAAAATTASGCAFFGIDSLQNQATTAGANVIAHSRDKESAS